LKWLVRTAMKDVLPADVVWRKRKMGFPFPYVQWATASRDRFLFLIGQSECPYVDMKRLRTVYLRLANNNPLFLWRVMSLCMWWKKCVLGESLG
jgi:asparagine synthase (glutamine-hydrolysing)